MIRIITDSAADLTPKEQAFEGVSIVPLSVTFEDDTTIADDGSISKDEFFEKLSGCKKLPRTSQPSPQSFIDVFESVKEAGDEAVVITICQKLSGTWQCANLAAAEVGGSIYIVDSGSATQGEAFLVREAVRLREEGCSAAEIATALNELKQRICIVAVVDSLKHLQKGGRVSAALAFAGGALGIKPVLGVTDANGEVRMIGKGRGRPGALVAMFKQIEELGGIDENYGYAMIYTDDKQLIGPVRHYLHELQHVSGGRVAQLGATIGTHIGPSAVGVVFISAAPQGEAE